MVYTPTHENRSASGSAYRTVTSAIVTAVYTDFPLIGLAADGVPVAA
jgi:hypothetical protein